MSSVRLVVVIVLATFLHPYSGLQAVRDPGNHIIYHMNFLNAQLSFFLLNTTKKEIKSVRFFKKNCKLIHLIFTECFSVTTIIVFTAR